MPAPPEILLLVARFAEHVDAYKAGKYKETQLEDDFIDPFFKQLGWDMRNEQGYAEAYRDVVHRDRVRVGDAPKEPDYGFRIGGTRKFFLEAKKPSVRIKDDIAPAYQLRRYAWNANLALSILTDFEEFAVYDCRIKPALGDPASKARIFFCRFDEYEKYWDWLSSIFSREAIKKGSFDKYAATNKSKRGTTAVDDDFLATIEGWRSELARNVALRNSALSQPELNFAVQSVIDRIIFLRICEDRGIEDYGRLLNATEGHGIYSKLGDLFLKADSRYNSGLFHFKDEKGRHESPDTITPSLAIDDKLLRNLVRGLYYPDSPYEFSVLSADILGQVYEQFLGKVITLTDGHRAKVEDKPEVKKAGGVYYTPAYIVRYLVRQTVGKLVEGKTPREIVKFRVIDPACGSGSFLIGAYQYLLDWYHHWYSTHDPEKWAKGKAPALVEANGGGWALTTGERKRILLAHIHGVDIDSQAVEVTKLSLLLKVLEGETAQTLQRELIHQRVLPDLSDNIKCGNSVVGHDFYAQADLPDLGADARLKINVFDWAGADGFPTIMRAGGFDVVIGNPPYIPIELISEPERIYFQSRHPELSRKFDTGPLFMLAMLRNMKPSGRLGFISSVTWQTGENFAKLRQRLFTTAGVELLINLPFDVFKNAYVDTGVYVLTGAPTTKYLIYSFPKKSKSPSLDDAQLQAVECSLVSAPDYKIILDPVSTAIILRLTNDRRDFVPLGEISASTQGLAGNRFKLSSHAKGESWFPFLRKGQARRYALDTEEIAFADMSEHLSLKRFYEKQKKLLIRRVISRQDRLLVALGEDQMVFKKDINPFIVTAPNWSTEFLLGILNSRLISFLYIGTSAIATKDDFRQTTLAELRRLPMPLAKEGQAKHDNVVTLVTQMLKLQKVRAKASTPHEITAVDRQIAAADTQIDYAVYAIYGLSPDEIAIVEAAK